MKVLCALALAVGLTSGCADSTRETIASEGARAYDQALETSEFVICQAASVGSVIRRYGKSEADAKAWRQICLGAQAPVIVPALGD